MTIPNPPKFTSDWFSSWIPIWQKYVLPLVAHVDDARWLELGSYEGRSALWTLDNLLQGKHATLTCIDAWFPAHELAFDANLAGRSNLVKLKGMFGDILPTLLTPDKIASFHGAYLDGSHIEVDTLACADMVWHLLRPGGVLVFDDYGHAEYPGVKLAVDSFLSRPDVHYNLLFKGSHNPNEKACWQVIVVKRDDPKPSLDQSTFPAMLNRAQSRLAPQTIVDVGASNGSWSKMADAYWPSARYLLVEANPVFVPDLRAACESNPRFEYESALAGASVGESHCLFNEENPFQGVLLGDLTNGKLVPSTTIDALVRERKLPGPYLLKFDVHGHELPILLGAQGTLPHTCAIIMEVYGWRQGLGSLRFWEMCSYLEWLGFRCTDLCEPLYRPFDGRLSQVDMLFERVDAPGMDSGRWE